MLKFSIIRVKLEIHPNDGGTIVERSAHHQSIAQMSVKFFKVFDSNSLFVNLPFEKSVSIVLNEMCLFVLQAVATVAIMKRYIFMSIIKYRFRLKFSFDKS
jgi:hypothetical protein